MKEKAMAKMQDIMDVMEGFAPLGMALGEKEDNVGLIIGRRDLEVAKVLLALEITDDVVREAATYGVDAIITHHPAIWEPLRQINDTTPRGRRLLTLIERHIAVYSAHTNLDACDGGINDMLFDMFGLTNKEKFSKVGEDVYMGRVGELPHDMTLAEFARVVQQKLDLPAALYVGDGNAKVGKVGIIAGGSSNAKLLKEASEAGCDTFLTADIRYVSAVLAMDMGLNLIEATHYGSEIIFAEGLLLYLQKSLPDVEFIVSKIKGQPFKNA